MSREIATLAGGCFWCTEALYKRLKGVISVEPGYSGGNTENPTYDEVCTGKTGHAEAIQIEFDPAFLSYADILEVFWHTHNPTTLDRQGHDIGTQYRSVIFYHNEKQKEAAEITKDALEKSKIYPNPVVTEIVSFNKFYKAEAYHKDHYDKNKDKPYCDMVITPKINKLLSNYSNLVKDTYK